MNFFTSFAGWLNKDSTGESENRLLSVVIRSTSIVSALYYVALATLFFADRQYFLGFYDCLGVTILMYCLYLTYKKNISYAFWVYEVVLLLLVVFQSVYVGWNIGFQYGIFVLGLVAFFTTRYSSLVKFVITLVYAGVFCGLYIYSYSNNPFVISMDKMNYLLSIFTAVYNFGCLAIAGFYFSSKSSGMDRKLIEYNKTLEKIAFYDSLTGLFNRRHSLTFLQKKIELNSEEQQIMSIALGDIDFFKKVNDVYGHVCGDTVLKGVSHIISKKMKGKGFASRWGGEEFLLIFPDSDMKTAVNYTQDILDEIRGHVENYNGYPIGVTMSFGIQQYKDGLTADEFITQADKRLYKAKRNGRNCIIYE